MKSVNRGLSGFLAIWIVLAGSGVAIAQDAPTTAPAPDRTTVLATMKRAATFMVDKVSTHGGYVWTYTADLSRRWGEMEAFPTMIWIQNPGTPAMGDLFLEAYHATKDEYYYQAAGKAADALVAGQHPSGGWNYVIDFAGEESVKKWYATIGKNGWRLEEFQHYYGNATFDDDTTHDAAHFMLRMYLEKKEPKYKASLDKAIQFVLDSQYANGGWPQRYPIMGGFEKNGQPDYTPFITFNDEVCTENIDFLILCYQIFHDQKYLDPIARGMNCFVITQQPKPQAGWGLQHDPKDLTPASARTYEPKGVVTHTTGANIREMIRFYYMTGDKKFLARLPEAFDWLDSVKLPPDFPIARGTHPTFIEVGTNKGLFIHREGSNATNGRYFADYNPLNTIGHYSSFRTVDTDQLRNEYKQAMATPPEEATKDSPLRPNAPAVDPVQLARGRGDRGGGRGGGGRGGRGFGGGFGGTSEVRAAQLVAELEADGCWLAPLRQTSNPYKGDGPMEVAPGNFVSTQVGDQWDTSPYGNGFGVARGGGVLGQGLHLGISTQSFIGNMRSLISYLETVKQ